jgi:hypothetical protein
MFPFAADFFSHFILSDRMNSFSRRDGLRLSLLSGCHERS